MVSKKKLGTKMSIFASNLRFGLTLTSALKTNIERTKFFLFCDISEGQIAGSFRNTVKEMKLVPLYGVPNATDIWKLVGGSNAVRLQHL